MTDPLPIKEDLCNDRQAASGGLTGPSPKSFSGFWNDMLEVGFEVLRWSRGDLTEVELLRERLPFTT